jgi:hypothetical protein
MMRARTFVASRNLASDAQQFIIVGIFYLFQQGRRCSVLPATAIDLNVGRRSSSGP